MLVRDYMCAVAWMNAGPGVSAGSLGEGGFGFSFLAFCVCVCVEKEALDHSEIRTDGGAYYSQQTAVSALGQIYWPGNHGSQ